MTRYDPDLGGLRHLIRTDPTSPVGHRPDPRQPRRRNSGAYRVGYLAGKKRGKSEIAKRASGGGRPPTTSGCMTSLLIAAVMAGTWLAGWAAGWWPA